MVTNYLSDFCKDAVVQSSESLTRWDQHAINLIASGEPVAENPPGSFRSNQLLVMFSRRHPFR